MDRSTGAYIDEKTGHEMQVLGSGRHIDLDAELERLGVAHDAADLFSPERAALRAHWANVGYHKDDDLTQAIVKQHRERHHERQAALKKDRERMAEERRLAAAHVAKHGWRQ